MAVVNSAELKQCEEGKLFLKPVKCFLTGRCGKSSFLSLGRDILYYIGSPFRTTEKKKKKCIIALCRKTIL